MSTLELKTELRPYEDAGGGAYRTARRFLDFIVDDLSLYAIFRSKRLDLISCLWLEPEVISRSIEAANRLLLRGEADLPDDRRSLFVCPECGDLGCGAVSVVVEHTPRTFVWRDFAYENAYCENPYEDVIREGYGELGPFSFSADDYVRILENGIATLRGLS